MQQHFFPDGACSEKNTCSVFLYPVQIRARCGENVPGGKNAIEWAKKCEEYGVPVVASGTAEKLKDFYPAVVDGGAQILLAASVFYFYTLRINKVKDYLNGIPHP